MIVADREKAKDILKRVNYYRFTGDALQFRQEPSGSDYIEGTTFETVYKISERCYASYGSSAVWMHRSFGADGKLMDFGDRFYRHSKL